MSERGWYVDPDDASIERWWDGGAWTEHIRESAQGMHEEVRLVHHKFEAVAASDTITIRGKTFSFGSIDEISYYTMANYLNGAYQGTSFAIGVGQGGDRAMVIADSGHKNDRLAEDQYAWTRIVDRLETKVCPRIVENAAITVAGGGEFRVSTFVAQRDGLRPRRPFAKPIPWSEIVGTERENKYLRLKVRREGSEKDKSKFLIPIVDWNVPLLARLVERLGAGATG